MSAPGEARLRRSALYVPGANPRALEKARGLAADMLILDLEDAVAPDAKPAARDNIAKAVTAGGYGPRELILRVNGLDTEWGADDLLAAASLPIHGVLLPKVDDAEAVQGAAAILAGAAAPPDLALWCMMETPIGVLRAAEIAGAHSRLAGLVMGNSDLAKDLHARHTPDRLPLITAMGICVLAARAHGLAILDAVHLDLDDDEGFERVCRQGRDFGFDGKTLIHPKTIATANALFGPSDSELAEARRIIVAWDEARKAGKGVVVVGGKLVEALHVEEALRLVACAERIAAEASAANPGSGTV